MDESLDIYFEQLEDLEEPLLDEDEEDSIIVDEDDGYPD